MPGPITSVGQFQVPDVSRGFRAAQDRRLRREENAFREKSLAEGKRQFDVSEKRLGKRLDLDRDIQQQREKAFAADQVRHNLGFFFDIFDRSTKSNQAVLLEGIGKSTWLRDVEAQIGSGPIFSGADLGPNELETRLRQFKDQAEVASANATKWIAQFKGLAAETATGALQSARAEDPDNPFNPDVRKLAGLPLTQEQENARVEQESAARVRGAVSETPPKEQEPYEPLDDKILLDNSIREKTLENDVWKRIEKKSLAEIGDKSSFRGGLLKFDRTFREQLAYEREHPKNTETPAKDYLENEFLRWFATKNPETLRQLREAWRNKPRER